LAWRVDLTKAEFPKPTDALFEKMAKSMWVAYREEARGLLEVYPPTYDHSQEGLWKAAARQGYIVAARMGGAKLRKISDNQQGGSDEKGSRNGPHGKRPRAKPKGQGDGQ
jgi:hypothetical protein